MKRMAAIFLAAVLIVSMAQVAVAQGTPNGGLPAGDGAAPGDIGLSEGLTGLGDQDDFNGIRIEFRVGDSTLNINGNPVTVQTPYIVAGTTLVPVRVITEAFGAEVGWDGESQTVTITYQDVTIRLTIGVKTAYVNETAVELLAAPELTDSTTMVPLRFITENFGADVLYNVETKAIVVTKEMTDSNSIKDFALALKRTQKERIGDSYYGWSMSCQEDMSLYYRSFTGDTNTFNASDFTIFVDIYPRYAEDTRQSFEDDLKSYGDRYTVMALGSGTSAGGTEYVSVQYKASGYNVELRYYLAEDRYYCLSCGTDSAGGMKRFQQVGLVLDTFDLTFDSERTEDLSDIDPATDLRVYRSDEMAFHIGLPGDFDDFSSDNTVNEFEFRPWDSYDSDYGVMENIRVSIYSSFEGHTYQTWAEKDHTYNKSKTSSKYYIYSDLVPIQIDGHNALYYDETVFSEERLYARKDIFIDAGAYFYNISITLAATEGIQTMENIVGSIRIGSIDEDEVGRMMRLDDPALIAYEDFAFKDLGVKFSAPSDSTITSNEQTKRVVIEDSVVLNVMKFDAYGVTGRGFQDWCHEIINQMAVNFEDLEMGSDLKKTMIGDQAYLCEMTYSWSVGNREIQVVDKLCLILYRSHVYLFEFMCPEMEWGERNQLITEHVIDSIGFISADES